jgi:predicted  nucleic acid-binding Zn-ribbon protein
MAQKTNTELIRDLTTLADQLDERVNSVRGELEWVVERHENTLAMVNDLRAKIERMDSQLADARKELNDRTTRGWSIGIALLSAFLAAALSFIVQRVLLAK